LCWLGRSWGALCRVPVTLGVWSEGWRLDLRGAEVPSEAKAQLEKKMLHGRGPLQDVCAGQRHVSRVHNGFGAFSFFHLHPAHPQEAATSRPPRERPEEVASACPFFRSLWAGSSRAGAAAGSCRGVKQGRAGWEAEAPPGPAGLPSAEQTGSSVAVGPPEAAHADHVPPPSPGG